MSVQPGLSVMKMLRIKDPNTLFIVLEKGLVTYITEKYLQAFSLQRPARVLILLSTSGTGNGSRSTTCFARKGMRQPACQCQSSAFFQQPYFYQKVGCYSDCCSEHSTTPERFLTSTCFPSWIPGIQHPPQQHNCNPEVVYTHIKRNK